ncbi:MAG TPA: hypothetical protein VGN16_23715 [Acidobacteriaceae bacterium]
MQLPLVPLLLTCSPFVLASWSCASLFRQRRSGRRQAFTLWAVGAVMLFAGYSACVFHYYSLKPTAYLPPWEDPETLYLALLFLLGPLGFVLTVIAGVRGASKWTVIPLLAASMILFLAGVLEGISV